MTTKPKISAIQNEVMDSIHSGKISMKPKLYFTVLWLAGIFASIAAGLSFAYVISIFSYIIRIQTASTPAYGARQNLDNAIATFPWWAVIASVFFIIIALYITRKYSRIYRYRTSTVVTIFLIVSITIGLGMSYMNIGHPTKHNNTPGYNELRNPGKYNHRTNFQNK